MKRKLLWPGLPIMLLVAIVVVDVTMVIVASLNPPIIVNEHPVQTTPAPTVPAPPVERRE